MPIYCDESGFTGNNMLSEEQPYFSYVAVNISEEDARNKINLIRQKYNIHQNEIKGQCLLSRSGKYKEAAGELFTDILGKTKFTISLKKYSLACSFFEYIFEPLLAGKSLLFYKSGFHKYIANTIYLYLYINNSDVQYMLSEFEKFMRSKEYNILPLYMDKLNTVLNSDLYYIIKFASIHRNKIIEEFHDICYINKWILDNSITILHRLLCSWTNEIGDLTVICDESKPLMDNDYIFNCFINRKDQVWQEINGERFSMIPHLSKPISFESSHNNPGLQLADIMSSMTTYIFKNKNTCKYAKKWYESLLPHIDLYLLPDFSYFLTTNQELWKNCFILEELFRRSQMNEDLLDGIERIFPIADMVSRYYAIEQAKKIVRSRPLIASTKKATH